MKRAGLVILLALLLSGVTAWAQCLSKRVQFPRGRTTAVLQGRITSAKAICYELRARHGQHMIVHLTSPKKGVRFSVVPPGYDAEPLTGDELQTDWEGDLADDGNYAISLSVPKGADTYTLEVTIR